MIEIPDDELANELVRIRSKKNSICPQDQGCPICLGPCNGCDLIRINNTIEEIFRELGLIDIVHKRLAFPHALIRARHYSSTQPQPFGAKI